MIFAIGAGLEVEMITDGEVLIRIGAVLEKRIITDKTLTGIRAVLEARIFRVEKRMFGIVLEANIFGDEKMMSGIRAVREARIT